jgi:hypothetical protein
MDGQKNQDNVRLGSQFLGLDSEKETPLIFFFK